MDIGCYAWSVRFRESIGRLGARFSPSLAYTLMCIPEAEAIIRHHLLPGLPLEWVTDPTAFSHSVHHQASLNQLELQPDLLYPGNQQRI